MTPFFDAWVPVLSPIQISVIGEYPEDPSLHLERTLGIPLFPFSVPFKQHCSVPTTGPSLLSTHEQRLASPPHEIAILNGQGTADVISTFGFCLSGLVGLMSTTIMVK